MARRKIDSVKWTLVLVLAVFSSVVFSRPQESDSTINITNKPTETTIRVTAELLSNGEKNDTASSSSNTSRDVKVKSQVLGESIKKVATQLLDKPNKTIQAAVVPDTRIPPKLKTQIAQKQKVKTRKEDEQSIENSHTGIAIPVTMEELELENKELVQESSTTNEGISTWILLSNPSNKENTTISTEPTKTEEVYKKQKPVLSKNKNKKPQNKIPGVKRPIIGSTNKSDLVAGGSAINENIYNKIKDTVLSNVQKNKNITPRSTTLTTTTAIPSTEALTTKGSVAPVKVTSKPAKKNNKNKQKTSTTTTTTTTYLPIISESAMLPVEPKEQEIELEVSTPATTTKKPKRSSTRKKTKTKKRKTTKPKTEASTAASTEVKTSNKTKGTKISKKPTSSQGPFTTQIYNYFSREVMPSVGVGVIGLAGLVGLASYFLYPFATPVRRTIDVDKKDDIYRHNAEEYGSEGNGQPEEEMLGTVLAGMPIHSKQKLNPYVSQTAYINRYPTKKDQDLRYRHVTPSYPNHSIHYPQQKTGIAHGAVYHEPYNNYNRYQYETRHAYTVAEKKNDKAQTYSPYPVAAVEPIYTASHSGSSPEISSYGSDMSSSVVYGVKPSEEADFKPVYPYDTQLYGETTSSAITYPPTSLYLGSNDETEESDNANYAEDNTDDTENADNKFVVGNVPKELTESVTPAVVPEHGPRNIDRKRRDTRRKRSVVGSIEEILKATRENKENEIFISNEIDDGLEIPVKTPSPIESMQMKNEATITPEKKDVFTVYAVSVDPSKDFSQTEEVSTIKNDIIESVSTVPIDEKKATETELSNEVDATTKSFKVYEVFTSKPEVVTEKNTMIIENSNTKADFTTQTKNMNTETTTEIRSETTSTLPPSPPPVSIYTRRPYRPTYNGLTYRPEVITYPPQASNGGGFFDFIKRLVDFKYRLGMSILQNTSESLNRYLRSMEESVKRAAKS